MSPPFARRRAIRWWLLEMSKEIFRVVSCVLAIGASACGQEAGVMFEAGSVKVATDSSGGGIAGGPGSKDSTRFSAGRASMGLLLRMAFAADNYRLSAPSGLPAGYFEIRATLPAN